MKNKLVKLSIVLMFLCFFTISIINVNAFKVVAQNNEESPNIVVMQPIINALFEPTSLGGEVAQGENGIVDSNLYVALYTLYNNQYGTTYNKVYHNMFEEFTTLNLSNKGISSLVGLNLLNLSNITHLNLSKNQLTSVSNEIWNMSNLTHLNLFNNQITAVELGGLNKLVDVNLNRNFLNRVKLTSIKSGVVRLSFNKFENINYITFPDENFINESLVVELFNNNITNAESVIDSRNKLQLELGLQGIGLNTRENIEEQANYELFTDDVIKFYNISHNDFKVKFYNALTDEEILTIGNSAEGKVNTFSLPVGNIKAVYVDGQTDNEIYEPTDEIYGAFKGFTSIRVLPPRPIITFNGKALNIFKIKINKDSKLQIVSNIQGATFVYRIDDGEWKTVENNEIILKYDTPNHTIFVKQIVNGVESYVQAVDIISHKTMPLWLAVLVFIVFLVVFFGSLPLIKKYFLTDSVTREYNKRNK